MFGYGSVGYEIAKRLKVFNVKINIVDLKLKKDEYVDQCYLIKDLDTAIRESNIIILTVPLTKKTEGLMSKNRLLLMKENSILVNIARGKIIREKDLVEVLKDYPQKKLGVVLDVFENEPLDKESELWDFDNVILTPHNSFVGENNNERLFKVIIENIAKEQKK